MANSPEFFHHRLPFNSAELLIIAGIADMALSDPAIKAHFDQQGYVDMDSLCERLSIWTANALERRERFEKRQHNNSFNQQSVAIQCV